jgi:hypothetical protein
MPPYNAMQLEHLILAVGIGLLLVIAVILARTSRYYSISLSKKRKEMQDEVHVFGGNVSEGYKPVPLLIWIIMGGYLVWSVIYILYNTIAKP